MLAPLASIDDFEARLPEPISSSDIARAEAALEDASTLVRLEAGRTWVTDDELDNDIPDGIVMVTIGVARRAFLNPNGYRQETLGDHSVSLDSAAYLTADERRIIAEVVGTVAGSVPGLSSVRLVAPALASASRILNNDFSEVCESTDE